MAPTQPTYMDLDSEDIVTREAFYRVRIMPQAGLWVIEKGGKKNTMQLVQLSAVR